MPATTGMKGEGYYDRHSAAQGAAIGQIADDLRRAAATVALPPKPTPITVLDLGSSEGRNAIGSMRVAIEVLRGRTDQPIQAIFSDLPSNNFNQLFTNLAAAGPLAADTFASATAGSFYGPLMPPGSVHIATCFTAIVWMDRLPAEPVRDFVIYRRPEPPRTGLTTSPAQSAAFRQQGDADLQAFLVHRALEIVPGGKLILTVPADDAHGRCCDGLYDVINDACLDLVAANRVTCAAYERFTIPVYFRTLPEVLAPLQSPDSALREAFTVDRAETLIVPTPFMEAFRRMGDVKAFASAYTGFIRAFTEPVARAALAGPDGDTGIIDALYTRMRQRLEAEPERYAFRYVQVVLSLTRR
jgi:S-adenosylmethionine-dependent carboxyl methyltransferase